MTGVGDGRSDQGRPDPDRSGLDRLSMDDIMALGDEYRAIARTGVLTPRAAGILHGLRAFEALHPAWNPARG